LGTTGAGGSGSFGFASATPSAGGVVGCRAADGFWLSDRTSPATLPARSKMPNVAHSSLSRSGIAGARSASGCAASGRGATSSRGRAGRVSRDGSGGETGLASLGASATGRRVGVGGTARFGSVGSTAGGSFTVSASPDSTSPTVSLPRR
jgi:hypothetical protein